MNPALLRFYLVLDPDLCGGAAGMVGTALAAAREGFTMVQLRAPKWKKRALAECGRALLAALKPLRVPLIVDDHLDVALAIGAQGVHVGQKDLSPADCRAIMPQGMILGLSLSNLGEARDPCVRLADYAGIGPVWPTATKKDAAPVLGLDGLARVAAAAPCPCVAIGGVSAERAPEALAAGADGVAVVSAVCGQPDPAAAARRLIENCPL